MKRCDRCESVGRKSEIKGLAHYLDYKGIRITLCNLCLTEYQDEVGAIIHFTGIHEDEENQRLYGRSG
jgi:hypothetical protein